MPRPARTALVLAALAALAGCDARGRAVGTWELAAVDGVGPAVAPPVRFVLPAGAYGADTVGANGMWHESTLDSLALMLETDGRFRARTVEARRALVRQNTYERPAYVSGAFGGDLIRDDVPAQTVEEAGDWTLAGDSLVLTAPRAQAVEATAARLRQALPDAPEEVVRAAAEGAVPATPGPRWRGTVQGDRVELIDAEGRRFTLRRAGSN